MEFCDDTKFWGIAEYRGGDEEITLRTRMANDSEWKSMHWWANTSHSFSKLNTINNMRHSKIQVLGLWIKVSVGKRERISVGKKIKVISFAKMQNLIKLFSRGVLNTQMEVKSLWNTYVEVHMGAWNCMRNMLRQSTICSKLTGLLILVNLCGPTRCPTALHSLSCCSGNT